MHMEAIEEFQFLKEQVKNGYFEGLIQKYLLDNTHVSITSILPEKGLNAKTEEMLAKQLEEHKKGLTDAQIEKNVDYIRWK